MDSDVGNLPVAAGRNGNRGRTGGGRWTGRTPPPVAFATTVAVLSPEFGTGGCAGSWRSCRITAPTSCRRVRAVSFTAKAWAFNSSAALDAVGPGDPQTSADRGGQAQDIASFGLSFVLRRGFDSIRHVIHYKSLTN